MKKILIIGAVLVLIIIAVFARGFIGGGKQEVSKLDPIDTVEGFYHQWLAAEKDPAIEPNQKTLAASPFLSKDLRDRLKEPATTTDPVLCQTVTPQEITIRRVFEDTKKSEVLVTNKDKTVTNQAVVTLNSLNGGWYINDIKCSAGEIPPVREFSFEKEGFLLKASIPKPFDPKNWHLIFTENNEAGHVAPLFFDAASKCIAQSGSESICKPETFTEATKVFVRAQMTERGAVVKRLEFVK